MMLRSALPNINSIASSRPAIFADYFNSLAVDLAESGLMKMPERLSVSRLHLRSLMRILSGAKLLSRSMNVSALDKRDAIE